MNYRQLLVIVDLRHDVSYLLQRASKLAQLLVARLHVLTCIPEDEHLAGVAGSEALLRLKQEGIGYLAGQVASLPCLLGECRVESGSLQTVLSQTVTELQCELVILGAWQYSGLSAGLAGDAGVQANPRHDVLVLDGNRPFWSQPLVFQLFLPLSHAGHRLLMRADRISRALDAQLEVVSVLEPQVDDTLLSPDVDPVLRQAERQLADWMVALPQTPSRWQVMRGELVQLLAQARASVQCQLLIVGAGNTQAAHLMLGSHIPALLRHAHGDLLILH